MREAKNKALCLFYSTQWGKKKSDMRKDTDWLAHIHTRAHTGTYTLTKNARPYHDVSFGLCCE